MICGTQKVERSKNNDKKARSILREPEAGEGESKDPRVPSKPDSTVSSATAAERSKNNDKKARSILREPEAGEGALASGSRLPCRPAP